MNVALSPELERLLDEGMEDLNLSVTNDQLRREKVKKNVKMAFPLSDQGQHAESRRDCR